MEGTGLGGGHMEGEDAQGTRGKGRDHDGHVEVTGPGPGGTHGGTGP